jgi:hypothetical protein
MWERMVEARGGRDRLHGVETLLVESRDKLRASLYRLSGVIWNWSAFPGTRFGPQVQLMNADALLYRWMAGPCGEWDCKVRSQKMPDDTPFLTPQLLYLLETRFVQPEVKGCGEEVVEGKRLRYVEVEKGRLRVKYYLPRDSYLPEMAMRFNGPYQETLHYKNYEPFDGIQLPTEERVVNAWSRVTYHLRYEINPEYDPEILTKDPDLADGPDGWRPKGWRGKPAEKEPPTQLEYKIYRREVK